MPIMYCAVEITFCGFNFRLGVIIHENPKIGPLENFLACYTMCYRRSGNFCVKKLSVVIIAMHNNTVNLEIFVVKILS